MTPASPGPAAPSGPAAAAAQDAWDQLEPTICIAVPGLWPNRETLARQVLIESNRRYVLLGDGMMRVEDLKRFPCDVVEHDPDLVDAIRRSVKGGVPRADAERIARHTYAAYVRGEGGSADAAREIAEAAAVLVRAGGLAARVESSDVSHLSADWLKRTDPAFPTGLYWAFVSLLDTGDVTHCSAGMHSFGLRDAITEIIWDPPGLASLVHGFLGMAFTSRPELHDGQKFVSDSGVRYTIRGEPCTTFPPGHLRHNPYGRWRLELIEG